MSRIILSGLVLFVLAADDRAGNRAAPPQAPATNRFADKLAETVDFPGYDDPKMTLQDALEYLTDRYDLSFDVDEDAFAKDGALTADKVETVLVISIAKTPIPKMRGVTLERVLRKIFAHIPAKSGATYLIHREAILVTTKRAASLEVLGDSERPLPPLVHRIMEKRLLKDALEEVAEQTQTTVLLDENVADKVKETVSAKFYNTPIDTAVRILADKANLSMVRLDKTLYVTTHEKAKVLREELEREKGARARMPRADEETKKDGDEKVK